MASITKRNNKYAVVYYYEDETGEKRQKWETYDSQKDALKRKAEVEHKVNEGTFIPPSQLKVSELLNDFVTLYGESHWSVSTYDGNTALMENYIKPLIGDELVQNITPRYVDQFYKKLQKTSAVSPRNRKPKNEVVSNPTIEKIQKLLLCAFKQAVKWEIIARNPFEFATVPKAKYQKRDIWTAETIRKALDACVESSCISP